MVIDKDGKRSTAGPTTIVVLPACTVGEYNAGDVCKCMFPLGLIWRSVSNDIVVAYSSSVGRSHVCLGARHIAYVCATRESNHCATHARVFFEVSILYLHHTRSHSMWRAAQCCTGVVFKRNRQPSVELRFWIFRRQWHVQRYVMQRDRNAKSQLFIATEVVNSLQLFLLFDTRRESHAFALLTPSIMSGYNPSACPAIPGAVAVICTQPADVVPAACNVGLYISGNTCAGIPRRPIR
jgi:hypothetical protein